MSRVFLGADLGTSGLKLAALDDGGAVVAEVEAGYDVVRPEAGWAESSVEEWTAALRSGLTELTPRLSGRRVAGLGFAGQMHGAVLVDGGGHAVGPALLWPGLGVPLVLAVALLDLQPAVVIGLTTLILVAGVATGIAQHRAGQIRTAQT